MLNLYLILIINILVLLLIIYFDFISNLLKNIIPPLLKLLLKVAGILQKVAAYFIVVAGEKLNSGYRNLTAYAKADPDDPYIKIIQECIQDPEAKNIALTGPYGSGKSSILKSFQLTHSEYHYLNISLASFKWAVNKQNIPVEEESEKQEVKQPLDENRVESIEYSMLQQIFYHVKSRHIPYSRFKRIKNLPFYIILFRAVGLVLWASDSAYLIWHEKIFTSKLKWDIYVTLPIDFDKLGLLLFAGLGAIWIMYILLRVYNNSKFHKLNLTSGEIEIAPDNDASILNKHLDELIYFFEATKFNVLIIEDLDRFEDPEIFVRLRELNTLINYSKQIGRKVTFIYALKDDVFQNEERTKFFDYIIPVIPVIDHRNSVEKVVERLTELGIINDEIPKSFIADISDYISDMRLLLNTLNEFQLYRAKLKTSPGSYVQLLAMMIFKNKYPQQFAKLHDRKGTAYKVLNGKEGIH